MRVGARVLVGRTGCSATHFVVSVLTSPRAWSVCHRITDAVLCGCQASPGEQAVVRAHWSGLAAHDVVPPCFGVVVGLAKEPDFCRSSTGGWAHRSRPHPPTEQLTWRTRRRRAVERRADWLSCLRVRATFLVCCHCPLHYLVSNGHLCPSATLKPFRAVFSPKSAPWPRFVPPRPLQAAHQAPRDPLSKSCHQWSTRSRSSTRVSTWRVSLALSPRAPFRRFAAR